MCLEPPHGQLFYVQLDAFKGEKQVGEAVMGKEIRLFKPADVQQYSCLGQKRVDAVHPFLRISAATPENESLPVLHMPQIIGGDPLDCVITHLFFLLLSSLTLVLLWRPPMGLAMPDGHRV